MDRAQGATPGNEQRSEAERETNIAREQDNHAVGTTHERCEWMTRPPNSPIPRVDSQRSLTPKTITSSPPRNDHFSLTKPNIGINLNLAQFYPRAHLHDQPVAQNAITATPRPFSGFPA